MLPRPLRAAPRILRTTTRSDVRASAKTLVRALASAPSERHRDHFAFHPDLFTVQEQQVLLTAALQKLDAVESRQFRQRRKQYMANANHGIASQLTPQSVQGLFLPDEYYSFEEVRTCEIHRATS